MSIMEKVVIEAGGFEVIAEAGQFKYTAVGSTLETIRKLKTCRTRPCPTYAEVIEKLKLATTKTELSIILSDLTEDASRRGCVCGR